MSSHNQRITIPQFMALKASGHKITMLTAYDYTMASLVDAADIEGILVGDSLGNVVQGHPNTLSVTLDAMIYHGEMVGRAVQHALVVADLPFLTYQVSIARAIESAGRFLKETSCQAVKLEGGAEQAETIAALVKVGIPVMGHIGLRPQSIHQLGSFGLQRDRERLLVDAKAVEQAGVFALVLECISPDVASQVTATLRVPTIGIGAGAGCDGQILVINDLLQLTPGDLPRHAQPYANLKNLIVQSVTQFRNDVRNGTFPAPTKNRL
jgi:3-methyl-2-oxobutanoate hydroxymethyltransferase